MADEYSQIRLIENRNHIEAELVATEDNNTGKKKQPPNLTVIICSNHQVVNAPSIVISTKGETLGNAIRPNNLI